jgi:hypothetical protein
MHFRIPVCAAALCGALFFTFALVNAGEQLPHFKSERQLAQSVPGTAPHLLLGKTALPPAQQVWYDCSAVATQAPCTTASAITQTGRTAINTFVLKLNSAAYTLPSAATTMTVNFYTPITTQQIIKTFWAGYAATTGTGNCSGAVCAWDFSAGPTQQFFPVSGTNCTTVQANHTFAPASPRATFASCATSFTWSGGHLMLAFDADTGTTVTITETIAAATQVIPVPSSFNTNMYNCWKSGTNINQASVQKKNASYTFCDAGGVVNGRIPFVQSITAQ